jgi:hypothetical protein
VTVTVQRRGSNGKYKFYKSYKTTVPAYTDDYSIAKSIAADGKFRAIASNGLGGLSSYKTFTTK